MNTARQVKSEIVTTGFAKELFGWTDMPNVPDEVVRNYLRGAVENLIPKIQRNYKVAIPVTATGRAHFPTPLSLSK